MGLWDFIFGRQSNEEGNEEYPKTCQGCTINYSDPYWDPCPYHGCTTYQTVEEPTLCYSPKCGRLLVHYN